jgi:spore coat protein U-like protein
VPLRPGFRSRVEPVLKRGFSPSDRDARLRVKQSGRVGGDTPNKVHCTPYSHRRAIKHLINHVLSTVDDERGTFNKVFNVVDDHLRLDKRKAILPRRIHALAAFLLCLISANADFAEAGTATGNLTVQITILASCTITAATLNFGAAVPGTTLVASAVTGSTTTSVTCTNGSPFSIGMDNGANASGAQRRMKSGANFINYGLFVDAGFANPWTTSATNATCTTTSDCYLSTGTGAAQSISIYGQILAIGTAPPTGTYTDTVTMTITY